MFMKEEFTTKEEILEALHWVMEEDVYYTPSGIDEEKIADNILKSLGDVQVKNPVLSYSWYLLFESLYIEPMYVYFLSDNEYRLPLWIYHNGGASLKTSLREHDLVVWYDSLKHSDTLDTQGEFGEFALWLNNYLSTHLRSDFLCEMKDEVLLNPDWKNVLGSNSKWNIFYEPEDWMYHAIL